jgi:hypothetical protein
MIASLCEVRVDFESASMCVHEADDLKIMFSDCSSCSCRCFVEQYDVHRAPLGSCVRPVDMAPAAPRCVFKRKSCAHVCRSPGNYSCCDLVVHMARSSFFLGSEPCFKPAANKILAPSTRPSRCGIGIFRVYATEFKHCSSSTYQKKSSLVSCFYVY